MHKTNVFPLRTNRKYFEFNPANIIRYFLILYPIEYLFAKVQFWDLFDFVRCRNV
jgi:hypothetical protein